MGYAGGKRSTDCELLLRIHTDEGLTMILCGYFFPLNKFVLLIESKSYSLCFLINC